MADWFLDLIDIARIRRRLAAMPPPHDAGTYGNWYAVDVPNLLALINTLVDEDAPLSDERLTELRKRLVIAPAEGANARPVATRSADAGRAPTGEDR